MINRSKIEAKICDLIAEFGEMDRGAIDGGTALLGIGAIISSRVIVEVLLALEDYAEEQLGSEFDWMSDSAMSIENSIFRNVGVLANHLFELQ